MVCGPSLGRLALASDFDKPFSSVKASGAFTVHGMHQMGFGPGHNPKCYINNCYLGPPTLSWPRSLLLYQLKSLNHKMSNFDVSTPQLKAAKNFMDAFVSLSICDLMTSLSKNFQYEAFGGATNLAKMDMEVCAEAMQGLFVGLTKLDVNVQ